MKRLVILLAVTTLIFSMTTRTEATLIDRGGGLIYDKDLNVTWLQDANYAMTSGYDADGLMIWNQAMNWAENLIYGGYDDWRLPITIQPDLTCSNQDWGGSSGYNCFGSEMGHLYYTELGNMAKTVLSNTGSFINLQPDGYWSNTEWSFYRHHAWIFNFYSGYEGVDLKVEDYSAGYYAWAVRDGDVATVPEPTTLLLLGSGLIGVIIWRKGST